MMLRSLVLAIMLMLLLASCGEEPVGPQSGSLELSFSFVQSLRDSFPSVMSPEKLEVDSLSIDISGAGMDPMYQVFVVENGAVSGRIDHIPAGEDRVVEACAWSISPRVDLYAGSDTVLIEAGKTTEATLEMFRQQSEIIVVIEVRPESTYLGEAVVVDASGTTDFYLPDSGLEYRFLLEGVELRSWGSEPTDTFLPETKGSLTVAVQVKNEEGTSGEGEASLWVLNRAPTAPILEYPSNDQLLHTLIPVLCWQASSDDDGDSLFYHVWLGEDSLDVLQAEIPAIAMDLTADSLQVEPLLAGRRHYWKVVADDGDDESVSEMWSLRTADAVFTVDSTSVSFPCSISTQEVSLQNLLAQPLAWNALWDEEWLTLDPSSGALGRSPVPVTLTIVSRAGLPPGVTEGEVLFVVQGYEIRLDVDMVVAPEFGDAPPDSLFLVAPAYRDSLMLTNVGCGDLEWSITVVQGDWLTVNPTSGTAPESGIGIVTVEADTSGLSAGDHPGELDLTIGLDSYSISVVTTIQGPGVVVLDEDSLVLGPSDFTGSCRLSNAGGASVAWVAIWEPLWLEVSPGTGELAPSEGEDIDVTADMTRIPSGVTHTFVEFRGEDNSVILPVSVHVPGLPVLLLDPRQLAIPADKDTTSFTVVNSGTGNLGWHMESAPQWCICFPQGGLLPEGAQTIVTVGVDRIGLPPGSCAGDLVIQSNAGTQSIPISMDVGIIGCDDPVYYEDFNAGTAEGWIPEPGQGTWGVLDERYVVGQILPAVTAWSEHALSTSNALLIQTDLILPVPSDAVADRIGGIGLRLRPGFLISIEGRECDRIGAAVDNQGNVFLVARERSTSQWFEAGDPQEAQLFFSEAWNSISFIFEEPQLVVELNGHREIEVDSAQNILPVAAVGLVAKGEGIIRFDRVFVCPQED